MQWLRTSLNAADSLQQFASIGCRDESLTMAAVRRAVIIQIAGLLLVAVGIFVLSRFVAVADVLADVQERVMHLGAWSAICYPLLYACCNILLLPGGFLSMGGGFFFGLWWGFLIILVGNVTGAAISFYISRWVG